MKLYIYPYLDDLTDRYHDGGGAVVITDRDPQAVLREHAPKVSFDDADAPTVLDVDADAEQVHIFPDAGCC